MPITAIHLLTADGERVASGADSHRVTIRAYWTPSAGREQHAVTHFDLMADARCPRVGDQPIDWKYDPKSDGYWNAGATTPTGDPPPFGYPAAPA